MKLLSCMLLAIAASAQSQPVPCGTSSAVAAVAASPSGRTSPAAAETPDKVAAQIQVRRPPAGRFSSSCWCGTVGPSSLTARSNSQEVPVLTGIAGNFRFDHVLLQETTRFKSDSTGSLEVGMGRSNMGADVVPRIPLKSAPAPDSFWYRRPDPPQITGAYDLVLSFKASGPLGDGATSNFSAGALAWEVCGYNGFPAPVR